MKTAYIILEKEYRGGVVGIHRIDSLWLDRAKAEKRYNELRHIEQKVRKDLFGLGITDHLFYEMEEKEIA